MATNVYWPEAHEVFHRHSHFSEGCTLTDRQPATRLAEELAELRQLRRSAAGCCVFEAADSQSLALAGSQAAGYADTLADNAL